VIEGPAVRIPANNVASWSMALHELCMNAFKHGALKMDAGTVKIIWSAPEQGRLRFRWSEHGGPPATIPKHRGFGSSLIESLGLRFDPEGLVCTIDALLPAAQDHL
jgi:two-component sensor histidine kinase